MTIKAKLATTILVATALFTGSSCSNQVEDTTVRYDTNNMVAQKEESSNNLEVWSVTTPPICTRLRDTLITNSTTTSVDCFPQTSTTTKVEQYANDMTLLDGTTLDVPLLSQAPMTTETRQYNNDITSPNETTRFTIDDSGIKSLVSTECTLVEDSTNVYIDVSEIKISLDMDASIPTGISKENFCKLMQEFKYDYAGYYARNAETIWTLCNENGLNEIVACGIIAQESGWGRVAGWGKNNYFGISGGNYSTEEEGLQAFVTLLSEKYLSESGPYYHGKTLGAIGRCYCDPNEWPKAVFSCMKKFLA